MSNWPPPGAAGRANAPDVVMRSIQTLVREARCYSPERERRIVRDVYDCTRYYPGLRPHNESCVVDASNTMLLLCLNGVIPINYRGVTYHIPVIVWVPPHYPNEAPVPYVRPTDKMVLRRRHRNLNHDGRVFLPHYLDIWEHTQFTLYGLVVNMIRVFSAEPPVNSRPAAAPPAAPNAAAAAAAVSQSPAPPQTQPQPPSQLQHQQQQQQQQLRQNNPDDDPERRALIDKIAKQLSARLDGLTNDAVAELVTLHEQAEAARKRNADHSEEMRAHAKEHDANLQALPHLQARRRALDEWDAVGGDGDGDGDGGGGGGSEKGEGEGEEGEGEDEEDEEDEKVDGKGERRETPPLDEVIQYREIMTKQIGVSMAEDHAYNDALDQCDEAFVKGIVNHEAYMKNIRNLSREQFFPRALWKKLEAARIKRAKSEGGDPMLHRGNSRLAPPVVSMGSI